VCTVSDARTEQAICNNAVWCDTVCRAHGIPGEFLQEIWINRRQTPRFYPNAVTLVRAESNEAMNVQLARLAELADAGIAGEWAVKDSYAALDLGTRGFRILFEAEWIYRDAGRRLQTGDVLRVRWGRVSAPSALADWELAWRGAAGDDQGSEPARIFVPPLLADDNVAVIAAYRDDRVVAGIIANRTAAVVGMSNMFVPAGEAEGFRAGCIAAVRDCFPGLPLVGYEGGHDLAEMRALGFDAVGPLRVWVKRSEPR
jgi:hypothetical protein